MKVRMKKEKQLEDRGGNGTNKLPFRVDRPKIVNMFARNL